MAYYVSGGVVWCGVVCAGAQLSLRREHKTSSDPLVVSEPQPLPAGRHLCCSLPPEGLQHPGQHGEHPGQAADRLQRDPRTPGLCQPDPPDSGGADQGPEGLLHRQRLLPGQPRAGGSACLAGPAAPPGGARAGLHHADRGEGGGQPGASEGEREQHQRGQRPGLSSPLTPGEESVLQTVKKSTKEPRQGRLAATVQERIGDIQGGR